MGPKFDKENHQKPSKWNKPNVVVETDSPEMREFEAPREKIASRLMFCDYIIIYLIVYSSVS